MKNPTGKIALVTGSTRGIGKAIAQELAINGATVLLHGTKKTQESENTLNDIKKDSPSSKIYYCRIENMDEVSSFAKQIQSDYGNLDILVNNAGIAKSSTFINMTNDDWDSVMKVNVYGTFYVTKAILPLIMQSKQGRIINISSIYGLTGEFGQINYSTSKAAIIGFTKALSKELAKNSITVNAICPGLIDTGLINDIPEKYLVKRLTTIPLGRLGKKEEIAKLVAFIASDDAGYITGQAISINGGMV